MNADKIRAQIDAMASHVLFKYRGADCGVDPLARDRFDMWCKNDLITVNSLDAVMDTPFFFGAALKDIAKNITDIDW